MGLQFPSSDEVSALWASLRAPGQTAGRTGSDPGIRRLKIGQQGATAYQRRVAICKNPSKLSRKGCCLGEWHSATGREVPCVCGQSWGWFWRYFLFPQALSRFRNPHGRARGAARGFLPVAAFPYLTRIFPTPARLMDRARCWAHGVGGLLSAAAAEVPEWRRG